jgi:hypothetical protein
MKKVTKKRSICAESIISYQTEVIKRYEAYQNHAPVMLLEFAAQLFARKEDDISESWDDLDEDWSAIKKKMDEYIEETFGSVKL